MAEQRSMFGERRRVPRLACGCEVRDPRTHDRGSLCEDGRALFDAFHRDRATNERAFVAHVTDKP